VTHTADVLIIGAGIIGAACADALAREGLRVTVLEAAVPGGGATAAGMGHIVVMDDSDAEFALTHYSRTLWNELASELPAEIEFDTCGTLWVAAGDEEMAAVHSKHAFYTTRGVVTHVLDAKALAEAEPNLRPGLAGGLLVPGDRVIYSPCAARWLLQRATLLTGKTVSAWNPGELTLSDGSRLSAGIILSAAGAATAALFPEIDVRPRKGHLAITDRYPGFARHQLIELGYLKSAHTHAAESVAFNVQPRKTGQLLIGSSRQYGETNPAIDQPLLGRMLRRALEYMPALAGLSVIRTWTGFRPATTDNQPIIGAHPHRPNLYLATGHEGLGITTSLGTARLIADLILGRPPAIDPTPYLPARLCLQP
jgi:glycine/D-amino acid oxidase-like deaminating enzyme